MGRKLDGRSKIGRRLRALDHEIAYAGRLQVEIEEDLAVVLDSLYRFGVERARLLSESQTESQGKRSGA